MREKIKKIEMLINDDLCYLVILDKRNINSKNINLLEENNESIKDFLWLKNNYEYVMFGDFIFWVDEDEYLEHQDDIVEYNVPSPRDYICVGECDPFPILINKKSGNVVYITDELEEECQYEEYGNFEEFMDEYVLGKKYLSIGSIGEWNNFLLKNKII